MYITKTPTNNLRGFNEYCNMLVGLVMWFGDNVVQEFIYLKTSNKEQLLVEIKFKLNRILHLSVNQ